MEDIQLTEEQKKVLLAEFNKPEMPSISELLQRLYPDKRLDGRTKEGFAVKQFLVSQNLDFTTKTKESENKTNKIELTESHKEYIRNNIKESPVGITQTIFSNPRLGRLNAECRAVADYMESLNLQEPKQKEEVKEVPKGKYEAPTTIYQAYTKVSLYILDNGIDRNNITAEQKLCLKRLVSYMNTFKFTYTMNLYESQSERDLFESEFVRCTYDKPDLTEEEVNQYIAYAKEAIIEAGLQSLIGEMDKLMKKNIQSNNDDNIKLSMGFSEMNKHLRTDYHQSSDRKRKLLESLTEKRSTRLEEKRNAHASILNLVESWKNEKTRLERIHLADKRKIVLEEAVKKMQEMPENICRFLGADPNELVHS